MPRRVSLPGAAELFRPTHPGDTAAEPEQVEGATGDSVVAESVPPAEVVQPAPAAPKAAGSGRVRHDEKITVYVSSDELLALEHARLAFRAQHGLAVDRGRIVRTAVALAIADFEERGHESELVRRLAQS